MPPLSDPKPLSNSSSTTSASTILATVLNAADIVFSPSGFRFRVKTLDDDDGEDVMMKDTEIGVGDMSDIRRVLRWRFVADEVV